MIFHIVIYSDYDCYYDIKGVFTDKSKAEKCKEYEEKYISDMDSYGRSIEIIETECSDTVDFDAKILELEEKKRQKQKAREDKIKEIDLAEFNRIKEKYNL